MKNDSQFDINQFKNRIPKSIKKGDFLYVNYRGSIRGCIVTERYSKYIEVFDIEMRDTGEFDFDSYVSRSFLVIK